MENQILEKIAEATISNGGKMEIVYRTGKALEQLPPRDIIIDGTIDAPARWVEARQFNQKASNIIVNRSERTIVLNVDETNPYKTIIVGVLKPSKEITEMKVNTYEYVTAQQMAERIKMHRSYFANRQEAMKLVSDLQNFKAKVNKHIQDSSDNRGNRDLVYNQAVESNLPKSFILSIPLFKGMEKTDIECEVYVNPSDLTCTLVSAQSVELADDMSDKEIDAAIKSIKEHDNGKDIVIIEV